MKHLFLTESGIFGVPLNALPKRNEESEQNCSHAPIFFRDVSSKQRRIIGIA